MQTLPYLFTYRRTVDRQLMHPKDDKKIIFGDGYLGLADDAPFQGIVVTAGAPSVPKSLLQQLDVGGRLVIPIGTEEQIMTRFTRISKKEFNKETFGAFRFVPMLKDKN